MSQVLSVCRKEIRAYFTSPIAYVAITVFLILVGFFFYTSISWFNLQSIQISRYPELLAQVNINQMVYTPRFSNICLILIFLVPLLTMRLLAEEKKNRTDELLLTSPLSIWQIILGKYLASLFFLLILLLLTGVLSIFTFLWGNPEPASILTGYLGLVLLGAAFLAIGLFFSSLTENQIVAAFLTISTLMLLWVLNWASYALSSPWRDVLNHISFMQHFANFATGVIDSADVIYYLSITFLGLFLTHTVLRFQRWR